MTTLALRGRSPRVLVPAIGLAVGTIGLVALFSGEGRTVLLMVAAVIGVVVACAVVVRPIVAAVLLVVVELSGASTVVGYHGGLSLYLVALALAVASLLIGVATRQIRLRWSPMFLLPCVWLATQVPSILGAYDSGLAMGAFVEHAKSLVLLFTLLLIAVGTGRIGTVLQAGVLTVTVLAGLTLVNEFVLHNATDLFGFSNVPKVPDLGGATARHAGPGADPNFWGRTLVLFVPVALGLYASRARELARHDAFGSPRWWLLAALLLAGGIYLTGSRGALIAVAVAVVLWLLLAGQPYRTMLLLTPIVVALLTFLPGVGSRLSTLTELSEVSQGQGDPSLVNRAAAQRIGLAMVADRPAVGVGLGNFDAAWSRYTTAAGSSTVVQVAPHNLYLQVAAETGILGLVGWLVFYGGVALLALRTYLAMSGPRPPPRRAVMAGLVAALVGWAFASVVLHLSDERGLFGLFAVVGAYALWQGAPTTRRVPLVRRLSRSRRLTADLVGVAAAVVVFGIGCAVVGVHQTSYTTDVAVPLEVRSTDGAYSYDLLSRSAIVPTYANLLTSEGVKARAASGTGIDAHERDAASVQVTGDDRTLLMHLRVSSTDRDVSRRLAGSIATDARSQLEFTNTVHRLGVPVSVSDARTVSSFDTSRLAGLTIAAAVVGLCVATSVRQRRPRRARR